MPFAPQELTLQGLCDGDQDDKAGETFCFLYFDEFTYK